MKKDQYFNLEVNLLNDDNIACMMTEMNAAEALGIYVMLLLHLRTKDTYEASCKPVLLKAMARRYDVDEVAVERVLREFDLFELDEERQMFRSSYLDRVMKSLEEKRKMDIENGKKGGRPKKVAKSAETPVSKGRKPTENQKRRDTNSREKTKAIIFTEAICSIISHIKINQIFALIFISHRQSITFKVVRNCRIFFIGRALTII